MNPEDARIFFKSLLELSQLYGIVFFIFAPFVIGTAIDQYVREHKSDAKS